MVFSSLTFLFLFLPLTLLCYYIAPRNFRNAVLFFLSLAFYAWGEPVYILLMLFSTFTDYIYGWLVDKYRGTGKSKIALTASMVTNILLLGIFKYSDFVVMNLNAAFGLSIPQPNLPLPVGISFYTFQTMSYTIDIYRGDAKMQKNMISFGAYVALFPQLIAGPIVRFSDVAEQLDHRRENFDQFSEGIRRFVAGMAKKVLIANNVSIICSGLPGSAFEKGFFDMPFSELSVLGAWLGIIAFSFQIYFDFSGYSDMAIGLGKMFGFDFHENFNYPYVSKSITEFWRRWHISLGIWFREYVYIPLGGNRQGIGRQIFNIAVVWMLTGIWHGASWNFFFWGVYYFLLLMIEKLFLLELLKKIPSFVARFYTLFSVIIGWVIFNFRNAQQGFGYLGVMFGAGGAPLLDNRAVFTLISNASLLIIAVVACTNVGSRSYSRFTAKMSERPVLLTAICNVVMVCLFLWSVAYLVDGSSNPFLYFEF